MSDWVRPDSPRPEATASTLAIEPADDSAEATSPGTPQRPSSPQLRAGGGLEMTSAISAPIG